MPGVLSRVYPKSVAWLKYGADSFSSLEERSLEGSDAVLWMLKSPATREGKSKGGRAVSVETDWGAGGRGLA